MNVLKLFLFVADGFHDIEINCFRKKQVLLILLSFFSFLSSCHLFFNERLHSLLLAFAEGSLNHIYGEKIWLYGFDSVFSQVLTEFLFVVSIFCSFCNRIRNWKMTGLNAHL